MSATGLAACLLGMAAAMAAPPQNAQQIFSAAVDDFAAGRFEESVDKFDRVAEMLPEQAPQFWQRGIALYYVGRYDDCRAQFESHRTVNPNDVENAAWHFLCVARAESPEAAREALLPVGPDSRAPMAEIYEMLRGDRAPDRVLAAADGVRAQFYAHLYIGLYAEALGRQQEALHSLGEAAADRYEAAGGYMHMVARVHVEQLRDGQPASSSRGSYHTSTMPLP